MIFVIKSEIKRDRFDTIALREKLYKELNQEGKHQVVMLPKDCTYKDIKVIIKEIEKG